MAKITLKQSVRKKRLLLTFFVLLSLLFSKNVFAQDFRVEDYVKIALNTQKKYIDMEIKFYDYCYGPLSGHGFLRWCNIEALDDQEEYFKLMDIYTSLQLEKDKTKLKFANNLMNAEIQFLNTCQPKAGVVWLGYPYTLKVKVPYSQKVAKVYLRWNLKSNFRKVRCIRISGIWQSYRPYPTENFRHVVYMLDKPAQPVLKSNIPDLNTKVSKSDTIQAFKESEAIVIKGAELGTNIKVYNPSGSEIESVISNNDVVKIKLPAKQIYFVQIGKTGHKVAL